MSNKNNFGLSVISFAKQKMDYIFNPNEKFVKWGADNMLPFEYLKLYNEVPEHSASIDFICNLILGDGVQSELMNYWFVKKLIYDYLQVGGYTFQVIKTRGGDVSLSYVDITKCRYSSDKTKIGYAEEGWDKYKQEYKWYNISKSVLEEGIFIYKNNNSRGLYPTPYYNSAVTSLKTMSSIIDYHNNNAENGFSPTVVINMNNGIPDIDTQRDIENKIKAKLTGEKGQKFILSFNESQESSTKIEKLESDNLDEKFETLQKFIQNQIIISHKITSGQLIGVKPENQGFSKSEFDEALEVFKDITIQGFRNELEYSFNLATGQDVLFIDKIIGGQSND
jgi:hypothetical protein